MPRRSELFQNATGLVLVLLALASPAAATPPAPPLDIDLRLEPGFLVWEMTAERDVGLLPGTWRSVPPGALTSPPELPAALAAGEHRSGRAPIAAGARWVELRLAVRSATGTFDIGAAAVPSGVSPERRLHVVARKPAAPDVGFPVTARIQYADRLVDAGGYTGAVQILPLRDVDTELVDDATGTVLAWSSLDAEGALRLEPGDAPPGPVSVRLLSSTRLHPSIRLAVLEPTSPTPEGVRDARPHELRTTSFLLGPGGADLGTLVFADSDATGRVQAFHALDVALDAWEALASPSFNGAAPGPGDSLRLLWGPTLRVRSTAYGGGLVEIASPGSGDTDAWSDGILLHEIGHFVAQRYLRDSSPGGIHLLGDVEQDLRLAWSEGLATAFSCWVRAHRAATRRNLAGEPIDRTVALFVNAGLPPPDGMSGGLQYVWDVESNTVGGRPLARDGTGSETNVAGVLWDVTDGPSAPDGIPGDDDAAVVPFERVWRALVVMRDALPARPATFEDFWRSFEASDPGETAFAALLHDARIEYEPDAAEPDLESPPVIVATRSAEAAGGILLSEILAGARIAVEIVNRGTVPADLGRFALVARSNTSSTNPSLTYTLPPRFVLGPGARVVVQRSGGPSDDGPLELHAVNWTVPWFPGIEGACMLLDAAGHGVDFVRWNSRDGTRSTIVPPPGTGWTGDLESPDFGSSLARRMDVTDRDLGEDFTAGEPTLGAPNDAQAVHRTFFPAGDVDVVRVAPEVDGVYTLVTRRTRSGAAPRVEIRSLGDPRPLLVARPNGPGGTASVTLRLQAGEMLEARCTQAGPFTDLGSYDLALYAQPDPELALPPTALRAAVRLHGATGRVRLVWENAGFYDSLQVRTDSAPWTGLAGDARAWETELPVGRHGLDLVGYARGITAAAPSLLVDVETWPESVAESFDALDPESWDARGAWGTIELPGRSGRVLASSPAGPYPDDSHGTVRSRFAVLAQASTVLRFEHVCIVRPEDTARLELSDDWGATWQPLGRWDWNSHRGDGQANWSDGVIDPIDWVGESLPLGDWDGRPIQIRFVFESDIHGGALGWFIDALRIEPATTPVPPPFALRLLPNVPNPFNPSTRVRYELSRPARVVLRVLDVRGRLVRVLVDADRPAGPNEVVWNGDDAGGRKVPSGVYWADLSASGETASWKLVVVR